VPRRRGGGLSQVSHEDIHEHFFQKEWTGVTEPTGAEADAALYGRRWAVCGSDEATRTAVVSALPSAIAVPRLTPTVLNELAGYEVRLPAPSGSDRIA
jgi:hypothetical protein